MKRVPLSATDGQPRAFALVDDEDYDAVMATGPWTLHGGGYAYRNLRASGLPRAMLMHRFLLGLDFGDLTQCDHIDRNRLNNQRSNLRLATSALNRQNQPSRGGSSVFRGVRKAPSGNWIARATLAGRYYHLGVFKDERVAALAAEAFRREHMPFAMPDPALAPVNGDRGPESEAA